MAITKEKKKEILGGLEKALESAKSVVFVSFNGLTVAGAEALRRNLKSENVGYKVAKKTLIKRALGSKKIEGDMPQFDSSLAIAYGMPGQGEDLLAPSRGVYEFQKKSEGKVSIIGGVFEGKYMSKEEMVSIASIPSMDTLRGMFVNIINSPIQRFVIALNQVSLKKNG